jgi:hypothetical protein
MIEQKRKLSPQQMALRKLIAALNKTVKTAGKYKEQMVYQLVPTVQLFHQLLRLEEKMKV